MSTFLRVFQHLLPRSPAWSLTFNKTLKKFFAGLAAPLEDTDPAKSPRAFVDAVFSDAFPATTRQLPEWRTQWGIQPGADDAADRLQLDTAWKSRGGQDPYYLQTILQNAGFPLYVHEWWTDDLPFVQVCCHDTLAQCGEPTALAASRSYRRFVRNPRNYTNQPTTGTWQCSALSDQPECSSLSDGPQCNALLSNEPGYLVNLDLNQNAPPPVPDDSDLSRFPKHKFAYDWSPINWPYFFYLGGATFPDKVSIPASRRAELERLVLKLRPTHLWVVMLVDYDPAVTIDDGTLVVLDDGTPVLL